MRRFLMVIGCFFLISGCVMDAESEGELVEEEVAATSDELSSSVSLRCTREAKGFYGRPERDPECKDSNAGSLMLAP
jgi:hypothetical protein